MDDDDLDISSVPKSRPAKSGRRARGAAQFGVGDDDAQAPEESATTLASNTERPPDRPVKAAVSGWDEDAPRKTRPTRQLGEGFDFEDERLRPSSPGKSDESDTDIPVIPELEEQQEEDMTSKVAVAPNVAVNRVATYRELDNDLLRQAAFLNLDNEIDLKLLTKSLSPEADLIEEDRPWDWDRLFTEVMSELTTEWEKQELESGEKDKEKD